MANPYELKARADKAARIALTLAHHKITLDQVLVMTDEDWDIVAACSGVTPPSVETQQYVLQLLTAIEKQGKM